METWFIALTITFSISFLLKIVFNLLLQPKKQSLPPGPVLVNLPIIRNISWLSKSFTELEPIIRKFHNIFGPIITLHIGSRLSIFISDHSLAYKTLVQNSNVFADRPHGLAYSNIGMSVYGPTWRLLRRNLTSEILHPSRLKSYSHFRKWALEILLDEFDSKLRSKDCDIRVGDHFQYAIFGLLLSMCIGHKLERKKIEEIQRVEHLALVNLDRFEVLNFWPRLSKILFRKRWSEFLQIEKEREEVMLPLIRERKKLKDQKVNDGDNEYMLSYVDTLFDLQLPDEKRELTEKEIQILCDEFLNAASDSTSTAFIWIMANLVKYPHVQDKLYREIKSVVSDGDQEVKEDDLHKMTYLKGVILEGLRRHPPVHFLLPHAVTEDVVVGQYLIPKNADVNFMVADMGWDPKVWEDPMSFRPERFIGGEGETFDITGSKEIKMMPFGAGRRICPGHGFALLHLEYFVANMVRKFEWRAIDGDDVDLSEKLDFTVAMKNPLLVRICPRIK